MASDGSPVVIPAISLVHGSQAPTTVIVKQPSGNSLPPSGKAAAVPAADRTSAAAKPGAAAATADIQTQVNLLNKYLNDSGRPDQFRVDPSSNGKLIQQINPASGALDQFPTSTASEITPGPIRRYTIRPFASAISA